MVGHQLIGPETNHRPGRPARGNGELLRSNRIELHGVAPDRRYKLPAGEQFVVDDLPGTNDGMDPAGLHVVEQDDIGNIPRCDQPAIGQAETPRSRPRRRPVHGGHRRAGRERGTDAMIDVTFFRDVERAAIVGAEREEGRHRIGDQRRQCRDGLRGAALAQKDLQTSPQLVDGLIARGAFMVVADADRCVGIQLAPAQQRRVAIDVPSLKGRELLQNTGLGPKHPGEVHHLRQPEHGRMVRGRQSAARRPVARRKSRGRLPAHNSGASPEGPWRGRGRCRGRTGGRQHPGRC